MKLRRCLLVFAALGFCLTTQAAEPTVTKIVADVIRLGVAGEPLPSQAKTIYLSGSKYARVEAPPDAQGDQILILTSEPDSWVVNLTTKIGQHVVDSGPKFVTRMPIFWSESGKPEEEFAELEFGKEMKYFGGDRSHQEEKRGADGKRYKQLSIKTGPHEVIMLFNPRTNKPEQIDLIKYGRLVSSVRYSSYETKLPFKKALFQPPKGIEMKTAN